MNSLLQHVYDFLVNLKAYPVIGSIVILALFAAVSWVVMGITGRVLRQMCANGMADLERKLGNIVRTPMLVIFLLFGGMFILEWYGLFPQSRATVHSVIKTLILIILAATLNKIISEAFGFWHKIKESAVETIGQMETAVKWLLVVVCIFMLLSIWKIELAPLLASAGFAGIVVAVAAKDSLSNLFGGLALTLDKPFKPGDYVVLDNGERGKVYWIGGRSTVIVNRDDVQISIPNSIMANTLIKNESAPEPRHRIRVGVGVAYGSDFDLVEKVLLEVALNNKMIATSPEPRARFRVFDEFAIKFELLCWAKQPENRGIIVHQIGKSIYKMFAERNIVIPLPQRDVHLHQ